MAYTCLLACSLTACTGSGSAGNSSTKKTTAINSTEVNTFSISSYQTGSSPLIKTSVYDQTHYTRFNNLIINGLCGGTVKKISVQMMAPSGTQIETIPCTSNTFTWTKTLSSEGIHQLEWVPQDDSDQKVAQLNSIQSTVVYDITSPAAPELISPTTQNTYVITNATTKILIKGRTLKDSKRITGPLGVNLVLQPDLDGVHLNFSYMASVPVGATTALIFKNYDAAGNEASSTLTIESKTDVMIAASAQEVGSSVVTSGSITIHSTAGYMSGRWINSNIKNTVGTSGIIGER